MIQFDCHAHVYERVTPVAGARYVPQCPAPLSQWLDLQSAHGLHGGVIVQVSFLGTDGRELLTALSCLDQRRFAGIAVVDMDIPESDLIRLGDSGVRGVRWNLVAGTPLPDPAAPEVRRFLDRLAALDMHLELQLESARLAKYLPALAALPVDVVIDHMGLPAAHDAEREPWIDALATCHDLGKFFVKLSAPYRGVGDPHRHIDRLLSLLPADRFLWGSDWPHTRHETSATYAGLLGDLSERIDDSAAVRRLYGLTLPPPP